LIITEGALFGYLIFSHLYLGTQNGPNWQPAIPPLLSYGIPMTVLLILNSVAMWWAEKSIQRSSQIQLLAGTIVGLALVVAFIILEFFDWFAETFTPQTSAFGSSFFVLTGFHLAHCVAGAIMLSVVIIWALLGYFDDRRNVPVLVVAAYWHFTDGVWILLFTLLFIAPRLH
jgi:heme/copper-type cytochrome/quinol oxidase subunit 3